MRHYGWVALGILALFGVGFWMALRKIAGDINRDREETRRRPPPPPPAG